jgi:hypothetical protein
VDQAKSRCVRSTSNPVNWTNCIFCKNKTHEKVKVMINIRTKNACATIRNAAYKKGDEEMLRLIYGVNDDLIAAEAKYHKTCHSNYISTAHIKYSEFREDNKSKEVAYTESFSDIVTDIDPDLERGKAFSMSSLLNKFKAIAKTRNLDAQSYTAQRLKLRLQNYFKDRIVFHRPIDQAKSEIVYSSKISIEDVINASFMNREQCAYHEDSNDLCIDDREEDKEQILYKAAMIIKSEASKCTGIQISPLNISELSLQCARRMIPDELYWILMAQSHLRGFFPGSFFERGF